MIKKTLGLIIVITLMLSTFAFASEISIEIDDEKVEFTETSGAPFIDEQSRTQVPLRVTMEAFGAEVGWDQENQTAIVEKDGIKVEVPIGEKYILKNGESIETDTSAVIKNNRTYLPIRAVVEAFRAAVKWSNAYQTVLIRNDVKDSIKGWFVPPYQYSSVDGYLVVVPMEIYYAKDGSLVVKERIWNCSKYSVNILTELSLQIQDSNDKPIVEKLKFDDFIDLTIKSDEEVVKKLVFPKKSVLNDNYDLTYNAAPYYLECKEIK